MILKTRITDYRKMIGIGQIFLVIGLLLNSISLQPLWEMSDFLQGFFIGLGGTLIAVSIVFNVRGLMMFRKEKKNK